MWWDVNLNLICSNIYAMVKQALHHHIIPIIGIPIPFDLDGVDQSNVWEPVSGFSDCHKKQLEYANLLVAMAKQNDWMYLNFNSLFRDKNQEVMRIYFSGGDGVHPNEEGHRAMAEFAAEYLKMKTQEWRLS